MFTYVFHSFCTPVLSHVVHNLVGFSIGILGFPQHHPTMWEKPHLQVLAIVLVTTHHWVENTFSITWHPYLIYSQVNVLLVGTSNHFQFSSQATVPSPLSWRTKAVKGEVLHPACKWPAWGQCHKELDSKPRICVDANISQQDNHSLDPSHPLIKHVDLSTHEISWDIYSDSSLLIGSVVGGHCLV